MRQSDSIRDRGWQLLRKPQAPPRTDAFHTRRNRLDLASHAREARHPECVRAVTRSLSPKCSHPTRNDAHTMLRAAVEAIRDARRFIPVSPSFALSLADDHARELRTHNYPLRLRSILEPYSKPATGGADSRLLRLTAAKPDVSL